jgi:uncharacterized membrane-anchored protein YhcB (DUF1043 family)
MSDMGSEIAKSLLKGFLIIASIVLVVGVALGYLINKFL